MHEVSCTVDPALAELLEGHFCEESRPAWSLLKIRDDDPLTLQGFFEDRSEAEREYAELRATFPTLPEAPAWREFDDQEWQDAYKAFIEPWSRDGLHWVPVWRRDDYPVPAGETAIYLDAGMAFGTGSHETTRLMARRLVEFKAARGENFVGQRIIDAGCGSGILAISAAKLGAREVYGFDRDPEAIRVSAENLVFNGLPHDRVAFAEAGLEDGLAERQGDLILANIQADVLKIHAESLANAIAPGGTLALSGILATEVDTVRAAYAPLMDAQLPGAHCESRVDGEWCDLVWRGQHQRTFKA